MAIQFRIVTRESKFKGLEGQKLTYAIKLPSRQAPINEVAELISERSAMSRGDVLSVLENLGWACKIIMRSGASVSLPNFGSLSTSIRSRAAKDNEEWVPERVQGLSLRFTPAVELRSAMKQVSFEHAKDYKPESKTGDSTPTPTPTPGGGDDNDDILI